eukprot:scaffold113201_cov65-Attheya_sp.AAC.1
MSTPRTPASTDASAAISTNSLPYGPYDFHETLAREISCLSMTSAFGLDPFPWQEHIVSHLNLMNSDDSGIDPGGVLLVRPTGGGKSLLHDLFADGVGGMHWSISPLLSLTADQESKINLTAFQDNGDIILVHLDTYRTDTQCLKVVEGILSFPLDTTSTIIIFSSPQALTDCKGFTDLFNKLTTFQAGVHNLKSVTIDEMHLFVQFGMFFGSEFLKLKPVIFKRLKKISSGIGANRYVTHIPILFMTATCTSKVVDQLELMTGIFFLKPSNIFWPDATGMR